MKILALEFSSSRRSVAVLESATGNAAAPATVASTTDSRTMRPLSLVDAALREAGLEPDQIECLVVGTGPGSYNGIRSAIAVAQGWQLARGVGLLGISSVDCLAAQAQSQGLHGRVNILIDAQRNEFYLARFEIGDAAPSALEPLRLATLAEVRTRMNASEIGIGPDLQHWFSSTHNLFPDAGALATLAASRTEFLHGSRLEPIYLRETSFVKAPAPRVLPS